MKSLSGGICTRSPLKSVIAELVTAQALREAIERELEETDAGMTALSKKISRCYSISRSRVYSEALKIKGQRDRVTE